MKTSQIHQIAYEQISLSLRLSNTDKPLAERDIPGAVIALMTAHDLLLRYYALTSGLIRERRTAEKATKDHFLIRSPPVRAHLEDMFDEVDLLKLVGASKFAGRQDLYSRLRPLLEQKAPGLVTIDTPERFDFSLPRIMDVYLRRLDKVLDEKFGKSNGQAKNNVQDELLNWVEKTKKYLKQESKFHGSARRSLDTISHYLGLKNLFGTTKNELELATRLRRAYTKVEQGDYDGAIAEVGNVPDNDHTHKGLKHRNELLSYRELLLGVAYVGKVLNSQFSDVASIRKSKEHLYKGIQLSGEYSREYLEGLALHGSYFDGGFLPKGFGPLEQRVLKPFKPEMPKSYN